MRHGDKNHTIVDPLLCAVSALSVMIKGVKLMGAVGALAPTVFLPRPEIIHICVPLFLPRPEVIYIRAPTLFSPV